MMWLCIYFPNLSTADSSEKINHIIADLQSLTETAQRYQHDCVMLEITSPINDESTLNRYIFMLRQFAQIHSQAHFIGIAPTPKAAYLFAQQQQSQAHNNFDNILLNRTQLNTKLAQLPLELISRLGQFNFGALHQVRTIGDLMALPIKTIQHNYGAQLVNWLGQLHGDIRDPFTSQHSSPSSHLPQAMMSADNGDPSSATLAYQVPLPLNQPLAMYATA